MPSLVLLCIRLGLNPGAAQTACAPQTRHPTRLGMHWHTQCWPYLEIFIGWIILIGKSESHDLKWQLLSSVLWSMCSSEVMCLGWVLLSGRAFQECSFFASSEHILSRHPRHYPPSPAAAQRGAAFPQQRRGEGQELCAGAVWEKQGIWKGECWVYNWSLLQTSLQTMERNGKVLSNFVSLLQNPQLHPSHPVWY